MNAYNRIMALARKPEYLEDFTKLTRLRSQDRKTGRNKADLWHNKMEKKWEEYPPPMPFHGYGCYKDSEYEYPCVEVISPIHPRIKLIFAAHGYEGDNLRRHLRPSKIRSIKEALNNDKYLMLKIDLTANKKSILQEVESRINVYRSLVKRDDTRNRETLASPWQVYDLIHIDGKNPLQITKLLYRVKDNPTESERTKAYYEQVNRAYKKAEKMISEVCPQTPTS